jgi:hypothetical protein
MAKPKKFDLENPHPSSMMKTRKPSPPSMKAYGTVKPVERCLQKKSDASYLNSMPTRTLWFARDWKRCGATSL